MASEERVVASKEKSPVDQVLDLFVFGPLGLAMAARTDLPDLAAKGRAQVEGQVTMARFIGQFAIEKGKAEFEKRLWGPRPSAPTPQATPTEEARTDPSPPLVEDAATLGEAVTSGPAASELAIHGYDALSASQVVQRLAGLTPDELEQVRRYEAASRGRKTVLTKISQL